MFMSVHVLETVFEGRKWLQRRERRILCRE